MNYKLITFIITKSLDFVIIKIEKNPKFKKLCFLNYRLFHSNQKTKKYFFLLIIDSNEFNKLNSYLGNFYYNKN